MLEALGNIGDFVGGIGVVVTLVYLAVQVRLNSKTVKSAAAESIMQSMSEYYRSMAQSPTAPALLDKGHSDFASLTESQQVEYYMWLFSWFRLAEIAHHHQSAGQLPQGFWDGQVAHLTSLLKNDSVSRFWQARKSVFSKQFQEFVDGLDLSQSAKTTVEVLDSMREK